MSAFTAEPWINQHWDSMGRLVVNAISWRSDEAYPAMILLRPRFSISRGVTPEAVAEAEANARLVCQAPVLHELCRLCREVVDDALEDRPIRHSLGNLHARLEAALTAVAKVEDAP